jgi:integrase
MDLRRLRVVNPGRYTDTKHRSREVPISPELYDLLEASWMENSAGPVCIALPKPNRLRKSFASICQLGGVVIWPRWCHTLRKNCEMGWLERLPVPAACEWLSHSPAVMQRHYHRSTEALRAKLSLPASAVQPWPVAHPGS